MALLYGHSHKILHKACDKKKTQPTRNLAREENKKVIKEASFSFMLKLYILTKNYKNICIRH